MPANESNIGRPYIRKTSKIMENTKIETDLKLKYVSPTIMRNDTSITYADVAYVDGHEIFTEIFRRER